MKENRLRINKTHFTWAFLIFIFIIAILIVAPFLASVISAYVLAFLFSPLFRKFNKRFGKSLSAFLCILILLLIIIVPLFFVINQIINEASTIIQYVNMSSINFSSSSGVLNSGVIQSQVISTFSTWIGNIISSFPSISLSLIITFFGLFYFLYDWENINSFLYRNIPLDNKEVLFSDVGITTKRIAYGLLLVGAIEFIIALAGFTISGVKFPLVLALLVGLTAFTLVLDASIIWGPVAIIYFFV